MGTVDDIRKDLRERYGSEIGVRVETERVHVSKPRVTKREQVHELALRLGSGRIAKVTPEPERLTYALMAETKRLYLSLDEGKRQRARSCEMSLGEVFKSLAKDGYIEASQSRELRLGKFRKVFAWARWNLIRGWAKGSGYSIVVRWWGFRFWIASVLDANEKEVVNYTHRESVRDPQPMTGALEVITRLIGRAESEWRAKA